MFFIWIGGIAGVITIVAAISWAMSAYRRNRAANLTMEIIEAFELELLLRETSIHPEAFARRYSREECNSWYHGEVTRWVKTFDTILKSLILADHIILVNARSATPQYKSLIDFLPENLRKDFGDEMLDFVKDGLDDRAESKMRRRKFVFSEILSLGFFIGKVRILGFRRELRRTVRKD